MSNWAEETFAPIIAENRARINAATWGHLFPTVPKKGFVVCSKTIYGYYEVIDEVIDVESSPWWFKSINSFISEFLDNKIVGNIYKVWIKTSIKETDKGKHIVIEETQHQLIYETCNTEE